MCLCLILVEQHDEHIDVYNEKKTLPPKAYTQRRALYSTIISIFDVCFCLYACWSCVCDSVYIAIHNTLKNANGFVGCRPVSCNFNHSTHTFIQTLCSLCHRCTTFIWHPYRPHQGFYSDERKHWIKCEFTDYLFSHNYGTHTQSSLLPPYNSTPYVIPSNTNGWQLLLWQMKNSAKFKII